jgi:hypothetical protein
MLSSQFNISISARINTALVGSGIFFYSLFGVVSEKNWEMIKITAPYQIPWYKTLELVVEFEPIFSSDYYADINMDEIEDVVDVEEIVKLSHPRIIESD